MRHIVIGTSGHIDHGKSTLVKALTGTDPDRLKEEKARGITIDLGFAHFESGGVQFSFIDVPGHERFIKNMLAGISGIDGVMLVVAADESVMPQTREHFDICRLLEVKAGLVALTKMDLVDEETLELVTMEVRELVDGSFLENAPLVPVSATTEQGLDELRAALENLARALPARQARGAFRLPIDRVFSVKGFGTVVTGTLVAGVVKADDELEVVPGGRRVKARGLQVHGQATEVAESGQRVAINLQGVEVGELARGDTLTTTSTLEATRRFDAVLRLLPEAKALRHGARVRVHQGTSEIIGRIALASHAQATDTLEADVEPLNELEAGESAYVRIRLETPVALNRGDRFVVRRYSPPLTIAGGSVLDPLPSRSPIRTAAAARRFGRLAIAMTDVSSSADDVEAVEVLLEERGELGVPRSWLTSRLSIPPADVPAVVAQLKSDGRLLQIDDLLVGADVMRALDDRLLRALETYHRQHPLVEGLPREEVRTRVFAKASPAVFEYLVHALAEKGAITARQWLALASHHVSVSAEETRVMEAVVDVYRQAGLAPPDRAALATIVGAPEAVLERAVQLLLKQQALVKLGTLLFHRDALEALKRDTIALKTSTTAGPAHVDVAGFKDRYGITRKFAIPLLEYLDRERITRRVGETRIVL